MVLLNERGEVAECTAANIFCARGGRVLTPPLSSGCLEGVTRSLLLELGPATGVTIEEVPLQPQDLYNADEAFITSTNRTLLGVSEIAGHHFPAVPGPLTQRLELAFDRYMADYVARAAAPITTKS